MKKQTVEYYCVDPGREWKLCIVADVKDTGVGDCGIFVEAKNEKEARKYFRNLIRVIRNSELEDSA